MKLNHFCLGLAVLAGAALGAAADEIAPLWAYHPGADQFDASVGVADLDGDNVREIIAASIQGAVVALDEAGNERWVWRQGDPVSVAPTIAELTDAPGPEIIILTNTGKLFCLSSKDGALLWERTLSGQIKWGSSGVAAADLDGDGKVELVTADSVGQVVALRADGADWWKHEEEGGLQSAPAIGDLDGDGAPEVVLGGRKTPLICLDASGRERWRAADTSEAGGSPILADLSGDGKPEIMIGVNYGLCAYDGDGTLRWCAPMPGGVDSALSAADLDGDGRPEVIAADLKGTLAVFSADGTPGWTANVEARTRRSPAVADLDGDGRPEVLSAGYSGAMHVFDAAGALVQRVDLGGACNASPAVADLRGDGVLTVTCPSVTGSVTCFRRGNGAGGLVQWPEYRYNAARTALAAPPAADNKPKITKFETGSAHVGRNECSVSVDNPEGGELTVKIEARQGEQRATKESTLSGRKIRVSLPYVVSGRAETQLSFEASVTRDGAEIARQSRALRAVPYAAELAELGAAAARLDRAADDADAATRQAFAREAAWLRVMLPEWRDKASSSALLPAQDLADLSRDLGAARMSARRLSAAAEFGKKEGLLLLSAANPWATFGGMDELAEDRTAGKTMEVAAFAGEIESAALNVFNLGAEPLTVRVVPGAPKGPEGAAAPAAPLKLREAVASRTQQGDTAADAIPLLNQADTLLIPGLDARQLYLEIDTAGFAPGEWVIPVTLYGLDAASTEAEAELRLTVWPQAQPETNTLGLCHWGYVHSSLIKDQPEAALADQIRHGSSIFVCVFAPKASFDANGALTGEPDYTQVDEYMAQHGPHGLVLFCGYQGTLTGPEKMFGDAWKKAHVDYLRRWAAHMVEKGHGYDDWALYPVDEPGLTEGLVELHINLATLAREADPKIRVYTDPVGDASLEDLKAMAPVTDIWCPNRTGIVNKEDTAKLDFLLGTGNPVFTYECLDNVKHRSPLGYYRGQSWLAWARGLKGIGFWTYCTSQFDPWLNKGEAEYMLIYPGKDIVPSKRWHAVRDGKEDHAVLSLLKERAAAAEKAGRAPEAAAEARTLLSRDAEEIARFCGLDDDGETPGPGGIAEQRRTEDRRWEMVRAARATAARLLAALEPPKE